MKKEKPTTKICKHCKTEIPFDAKVCPQCRKKQGAGCLTKILIFIGIIIVISVIGSMMGGDDKSNDTNDTSNKASSSEKIEYTKCTADELIKALDENPAKASKTYKNEYLELTGTLSNIDSDGAYIGIEGNDEFSLINVQCYIKNEKQENKILEMSIGDKITIKGKCTDVGEVLGYSIDIDSIK